MKLLLTVSVFFLAAALVFQFRHELLMTDSEMSERMRKIDNRIFHLQAPFGNSTRQELVSALEAQIERAEATKRGEKTIADSMLEEEILTEKKADRPVLFFLYGAALLFLFGAIMKKDTKQTIRTSSEAI